MAQKLISASRLPNHTNTDTWSASLKFLVTATVVPLCAEFDQYVAVGVDAFHWSRERATTFLWHVPGNCYHGQTVSVGSSLIGQGVWYMAECFCIISSYIVSWYFWATVCKTVRPMLSDRCLSVLSVCDVGVLWPNGLTDQDETWHAGRPQPWPHC